MSALWRRVAAPLPVEDQWPSPRLAGFPIASTEEQLRQEPWYHGQMSRRAAEKLLRADGDFLVRDSVTNPGQYVLTGMHAGRLQAPAAGGPWEGVVSWSRGEGPGQVLRMQGRECRDRTVGGWCGAGLEAASGGGGDLLNGVSICGTAQASLLLSETGAPTF